METRTLTPLDRAIAQIGLKPLAKALGLTYPSFYKWQAAGRLPLTELSGDTSWAAKIEVVTQGKVSRAELLAWSFPNRICECRAPADRPPQNLDEADSISIVTTKTAAATAKGEGSRLVS